MSAEMMVGVAASEGFTEPMAIRGVRSRIRAAVYGENHAEFDRLMADRDGAAFVREQAAKASNFRRGLGVLAMKGSLLARRVLSETIDANERPSRMRALLGRVSAPAPKAPAEFRPSRSGPPPIRPYG